MAARSWGVTVCASALLAAVAHGCVDDGVSAHVICPIPPEYDEGGCTYEADGEECLLDGVLNLLATDRYAQVLRVESGLKARVREVPPQGETNRIQFNRAKVELRDASGARFLFENLENPYYVTVTGFVAPSGVGQASATLITPPYARQLNKLFASEPPPSSAQIVVVVTLKGTTDGNTSVSSGEFLWPVRVLRASVSPTDPSSSCIPQDEFCPGNFGQDVNANTCAPR